MTRKSRLDPLTRLAIKHGTDKWGVHKYTDIYHRTFGARRTKHLRLFEIGIGGYEFSICGGASLRMWAEYFPNAKIVGLDIFQKSGSFDPRIKLYTGSQSDTRLLQFISEREGPFDIVIDDGSHRVADVSTSFETLFPLLSESGIYVVEDLQTAFWPDFGGNTNANDTILSRAIELIKSMHAPEVRARGGVPILTRFSEISHSVQIYRNMIFLFRGDNTYPSNYAFKQSGQTVKCTLNSLAMASRNKSFDGPFVLRASMLRWAGAHDEALKVVREALAAFPVSAELLFLGYLLSKDLMKENDAEGFLLQLNNLAAGGSPVPSDVADSQEWRRGTAENRNLRGEKE